MGVEAIVRVIETEAEAEARRVVEEARRAAAERLARAEAAAEAAVEAAAGRLEAELRSELVRAVNAARRRRLEAEAAALVAMVGAAADAARAELEAIADAVDAAPRARWSRALRAWLEDALPVTGIPARAVVRPVDVALVAGLDGIEVVADPDLPPGCRVIGRDGRVEVEATLPVRLARAQARCAEVLARALGLAGTALAAAQLAGVEGRPR